MKTIYKLLREEQAATAVEYAVMLGLILLAAIVGVSAVSSNTGGMWGGIDGDLDAVNFGDPPP